MDFNTAGNKHPDVSKNVFRSCLTGRDSQEQAGHKDPKVQKVYSTLHSMPILTREYITMLVWLALHYNFYYQNAIKTKLTVQLCLEEVRFRAFAALVE